MILLEMIAEFFVQFIYEFLILGLFKIAKRAGVFIIKIGTFNKKPFNELYKQYEGRALPYWIGFAALIGLGFLIFNFF